MTIITSLAAELTLEFIGGTCLHKYVEPACWLAQFAELACRHKFAELACLHQVWGVCLHTSKSNSYSNCTTFAAISFTII